MSSAKNALNFEVAADQVAYNLKDRMATYEVVLRGVKGYFEGLRADRPRAEFQDLRGGPAAAVRPGPGLQGVSLILHAV